MSLGRIFFFIFSRKVVHLFAESSLLDLRRLGRHREAPLELLDARPRVASHVFAAERRDLRDVVRPRRGRLARGAPQARLRLLEKAEFAETGFHLAQHVARAQSRLERLRDGAEVVQRSFEVS